jgi:GT2 family glycosyltransferase
VSAPSIAVIVCTYAHERWDDLVRAVASVRAQDLPARRIVVVVDGDEGLHRRVRTALPGVTAVLRRGGRGLSGARNAGVAEADEDVVAFLDDDAEAAPDWLRTLAGLYEDADVAGAGGAVEPAWDDGRPAWFPEEFDWVVGCSFRGLPTRTCEVRNLIGANMSFRREALELAGGFRDELGRVGARPVGCEETELCIRVHELLPRARLLYAPHARVRHRVPAGRAPWAYFWRRCWAEGRSKAIVAGRHGSDRALAAERAYTLRVLPAACARGPLPRSGAIAAGLAVTTAGYLAGTFPSRGRAP